MTDDAQTLLALARLIARGAPADVGAIRRLATSVFAAGATRAQSVEFFLDEIRHYVYAGDTLLHVAAAAYDLSTARLLASAGADVRARNRRGAEPLHYAADGSPGSDTWNPAAQAEMVRFLIASGADPDAFDKDGVGPLHRAVRTRCTGAVRALLACGANATLRSGRGSTPRDLAVRTTGRGGAGSPEARAEQAAILRLLDARGDR